MAAFRVDPQAPQPLNLAAEPQLIAKLGALRVRKGRIQPLDEVAAREVPFELRINGRSHIVLMITPDAVRELAMGFCLSEGVVRQPDQVLEISLGEAEIDGLGQVLWADVTLPRDLARQARTRRVAPAATSCGLCGLESFSQIKSAVAPVTTSGWAIELDVLFDLFAATAQRQDVFNATGGTHAAALGGADGELWCVVEDIGRHNALDKALGTAVLAGRDLGRCAALLSGRISYEIALKIARTGVPLIGSVSAPTALAVNMLESLGVTLLGFGRAPRANVYTHAERVLVRGKPLPAVQPPAPSASGAHQD